MPVFTSSIEMSDDYPTIRPTLDLNFAATKTLDRRITFTRDSLGTFTDENGMVKYATNNVPRFDHDPTTGESLGLLIEESRTNKRTYSAAPNASNNYRIYGTPTYNTTDVVAPDGTTTATKIVGDGIVPAGFDNYSNNYGGDQDIVQTYSVYVKNINATSVIIRIITGIEYTFTFATETGVLTGGSNDGGGFQKLPNGWYRVWLTDSKPNGYWYHQVMIDAAAVTSNSMYFWGVQLEIGSFPTSYIPTNGTTVTRTADLPYIEGSNFSDFYDTTGSGGTFFVEFGGSNTSGTILSLGPDSGHTQTTQFGHSGYTQGVVSSNYNAFNTYGGSGATDGGWNTTGTNKFAFTITSTQLKLCGNGKSVQTGSGTTPIFTNFTKFTFGGNVSWDKTYTGQQKNHIISIKYYRSLLPDAQLQGLTQQ